MARGVIPEIRRRLTEDRLTTLALIEKLDAGVAGRRPRPDAWSIKDHVAHLAAVEEAVIVFARRILEEERPVADSYDVDTWNARQQAQRASLSWEDVLAELSSTRGRLLAVLEETPEQALNRTGSHPVWGEPITLASVLRVPYRHERSHRDEIKALLKQ
ncbi:MAG: hypothetical protein Kow0063_34840 [Anaerolineae bacterium]